MSALMISLFIASWLPYALVATFGFVGLHQLVTPYSAELPVMLAKASAIWNPIVYALKHPRYRAVLATYLPKSVRLKCCRAAEGSSTSKTTSTRSYESQRQQTTAVQSPGDVQIQQLVVSAAVAAVAEPDDGEDVDNL